MGALHAGHARLVELGAMRPEASRSGVVVSVFVNPTQFNDPGDLARYPRTLETDMELCRAAGADVVFAPAIESVYPHGANAEPMALPAVATQPGLEDAHRPGHFAGVCQVVKRLFDLVRPSAAMFGEKDWQQLQVIHAMVAQEGLPVEIVPVETVREADGLAMSSRNVFLPAEDRVRARSLSAALCEACAAANVADAQRRMEAILSGAGASVEYAVVRDAATLMPLPTGAHGGGGGRGRTLIAARVGKVRLIDNAAWSAAG